MYEEEKGNLSVMKGVSVRTGEVELTKGCRSWLELGGAGSRQDGAVIRIGRKRKSCGGKESREEGRKKKNNDKEEKKKE